jgi:LmbE family N-acetylglucosaminyl deacetylase
MRMDELGTILGIFAHPDDETYLLAGTMASAVRAGRRVSCVTATRGEEGSWDQKRWPTATMGQVREKELLRSMDILGVREHHFLDYYDGTCAAVPAEEALTKLAPIFRDVDPDSVFSFGPDGMTDHADHKATCAWATEAFRRWAHRGARLFYATTTPEWAAKWVPIYNKFHVFMSDDTPPVTPADQLAVRYELPSDILELKMQAIEAHESQTFYMTNAFGRDVFSEGQRVEMWRLAEAKG